MEKVIQKGKFARKENVKHFVRPNDSLGRMVSIIKTNADIRRFTGIAIINYLAQKGKINGEKRYVKFLHDKFSVLVDGIGTEYRYSEPFFINCFISSFSIMANYAQLCINDYTLEHNNKTIADVADMDTINEVVAISSKHCIPPSKSDNTEDAESNEEETKEESNDKQ